MNRYFAAGIVIAAALLSTGVLAQSVNSYSPTEQEWLAWPDYCRARFVVSGAGRETQYALRVPSGVVARYEAQIGSTAWHWLHHFCAGLVFSGRAQGESDPKVARHLRDVAQAQYLGQYQRGP